MFVRTAVLMILAVSVTAQQPEDPIGIISAIIVDSGGQNSPNTLYVAATQAWKGIDDGSPWTSSGTGYVAPEGASSTVLLAANADFRWGPGDWEQSAWSNKVTSSPGTLSFGGYGPRRLMAVLAGAWALVLAAAVLWSRREVGS